MFSPLVTAIVLSAVARTGPVCATAAGTVGGYPCKGAPYAAPRKHGNEANTPLDARRKAARENERERFGANGAAPIAHYKPGYHDSLPRTPKSEAPEDLPRSTA